MSRSDRCSKWQILREEAMMTQFSNNAIRELREEAPMAYLLLIVEEPQQRAALTEAEGRSRYERMVRFSEDLKSRGMLSISQSLTASTNGARVRAQGNQISVVDGPFAESKEMIGGFFLLTCETRAQAVAIARECPATQWATIEVRELGPCFS
jgi:hypothetical protein